MDITRPTLQHVHYPPRTHIVKTHKQRLGPGPLRNASPPDGREAERIDRLYGLEPVIEPGMPGENDAVSGNLQFCRVQCPYCGEAFETPFDASAGAARYIEDCAVCCQPIEFSITVDLAGELQGLAVTRSD
jgi:hypothetical protein